MIQWESAWLLEFVNLFKVLNEFIKVFMTQI